MIWCMKAYIIAYVKIQKNEDIISIMWNLQPNCCLEINFPRLVLENIIGNMLQRFFIEILAVTLFACTGKVSLGELRKWIRYIHSKISIKQIRNYIGQGSYLCDQIMLYCFAGITIW